MPPEKGECIGCYRQLKAKSLVITPCEHKYCHRCLRNMAKVALKDKQFFPARCCGQEIPSKQILPALKLSSRRLYVARECEQAVPPADRWYCPRARCGRWISPKHIRSSESSQRCPSCRTLICSTCRGPYHNAWECSNDIELQGVMTLACDHQWQRCYRCHTMVEKMSGCYHIKCTCGAHFCYKCGARYKTCSCDDNDDNRLAADGDIDIPAVVAAMNEAERQENEMVEQEQMEIDYDYQRMTEIILQEYRGGQQQQMGERTNGIGRRLTG